MNKYWRFFIAFGLAGLVSGCATRNLEREAHQAACATAWSEFESLMNANSLTWAEFASLYTVYNDKCVDRNPQTELKLSYLRMLAVKVDSGQMTPEEGVFALQKLDYDLRMNAIQTIMQYQALMQQQQLLERSVRAQERSATAQERQSLQLPPSRTTYCSGSRSGLGTNYSFFCN